MRKITKEEFIQRASIIHNKYLYDKINYINTSTKVIITCPIHGDFEQTPNKHLRGQGCQKCYRERQKFIPLSNTQEFIEKAKQVHGDKYDYSKVEYKTAKTKVIIICKEHGEFEQTPDNHLHGKGCPKCVKNYKLTQEEFIKRAKEIHNDFYDYSQVKYNNIQEKVTIICPKHGKFEQRPVVHLLGCGCPKCSLHSQTILYNKLVKRYSNLDILFEVGNKTVPWLKRQRFDIYIPSLNIAVEYNGHQHYMPIKYFGDELAHQKTLEKDDLKRQKCKNNDCLLLKLKYDYTDEDFNNVCKQIDDRIGLIQKCEKGGKIDDIV